MGGEADVFFEAGFEGAGEGGVAFLFFAGDVDGEVFEGEGVGCGVCATASVSVGRSVLLGVGSGRIFRFRLLHCYFLMSEFCDKKNDATVHCALCVSKQ